MSDPDRRVSEDAYGFFIFISYRLPLDVLERFKTHWDPRVAKHAQDVFNKRKEKDERETR